MMLKNACWVLLESSTQYPLHRAKGLAAAFPRSVAWGRGCKNLGSAEATLVKNRALFGAKTPSEQGLFQSKAQSLACVPQAPGAQLSLCGRATGGGGTPTSQTVSISCSICHSANKQCGLPLDENVTHGNRSSQLVSDHRTLGEGIIRSWRAVSPHQANCKMKNK